MRTYKQKETDLKTKWKNFKLVWKYPFLKPSCGYGCDMEYHRLGYKYRYEETWLDEVPEGWMSLALELCEKLKQIIEEDHLTDYVITQVKEKWGELCWYYDGGNKRIRDLTIEYEQKSRDICIRCGKPSKYVTKGWMTYICEDCVKRYYGDHPEKIQPKKNYTWEDIEIPEKYK